MNKVQTNADFESLVVPIHQLSAVLARDADHVLQQALGLGYAQCKLIWVLRRAGQQVNQSQIADWLNQTPAAISRQMKLLAARGLVAIAGSALDKRDHMIQLTAQGEAFADDSRAIIWRAQQHYFADLSPAQSQQIAASFQQVLSRICNKK